MGYNRAWSFVMAGGAAEAVWPAVMKVFTDMSDWTVAAAAFLFSCIATLLLYFGIRGGTPVGPSYAVWVGIGAGGVTAIDAAFLGQTFSGWGYLCI